MSHCYGDAVAEPPSDDELERLPIFPLPGLVLFPHTRLPLHFFEPRYRQLMADCLERGPRCMAIAQVRAAERAGGDVPIHERACIGRIAEHERNQDGTYDVVLDGIARVVIEELPSDEPYRLARARVLEDRLPSGGVDDAELRALIAVSRSIAALVSRSGRQLDLALHTGDPPVVIIDRLADQLVAEPAMRQELLETVDVERRLAGLLRAVVQIEAGVRASIEGGPGAPN